MSSPSIRVYNSRYFDGVFIVENEFIIKKFYSPFLSGKNLLIGLRELSREILNNIGDTEYNGSIMVATILQGGRYYQIYDNLKEIREYVELGEIIIKSREKYIEGDIATRIVKDLGILKYLCNKQDVWTIFMGETIASGSTMETFINYIARCVDNIDRLVILGFHSYPGIQRVISKLRRSGIHFEIYSYGGLLGLGNNLTDMTLGDRPNEIPPSVYKKVIKKLGQEVGNKLCMIGDFTYNIAEPHKYIAERIVQLWEIYKETDTPKALILIREGITKLMTMGKSMEEIDNLIDTEYRRRLKLVGKEPGNEKMTVKRILNNM